MSKVFNMVGGGGGPAASISVTGLSQTDTVTATNGSKTLAGKWLQKPNPVSHGLPDGYTELEYIESTGTQYIDTGVFPDTNSGYEFDVTINSPFSSSDSISTGSIIGCYTVNDEAFGISVYTSRFETGVVSFGSGRYAAHLVVGSRMQISLRNRVYTTSTGGTETISNSLSTTISAYLFASHDTSVSGNIWGMAKAIMYSAKMYDGDTIIRNYIPAKRNSDSAIGLYDIVSGTFFENSGTGEFIAGAEVPQTIDGFLIKPIRELGTWTVTATDGVRTAIQDVLVDVITEYEIDMNYTLYLYRYGDECEDVTGGWVGTDGGYNATKSGTKNSDSLYCADGSWSNMVLGTNNKVNFTGYTKMYVTRKQVGTNLYQPWVTALIDGKDVGDSNRYPGTGQASAKNVVETAEVDISAISGEHYVIFCNSGSNGAGYLYQLWLE